ncbi:acyl-CoA dehydrogenase domain-containing protein [Mycolicibacterium rhodesiae JS60]|nr:acyl-CoA dehydrogenase domain-containing protein [Mycolicibacterium rhodesiae JS60]
MEFTLSEEESIVGQLASEVFGRVVTKQALEAAEDPEGAGWDRRAWTALADSGLLAVGLAEVDGGSGVGFVGSALVLEQAGRTVAPVPLWSTLGAIIPAFSAFPDARRRDELLTSVTSGEAIIAAALSERGADPLTPSTTAVRSATGWQLSGTKICVPAAPLATSAIVSAHVVDLGPRLFLVPLDRPGLTMVHQKVATAVPEADLVFDGVEVSDEEMIGSRDDYQLVARVVDHATVAACAMTAGVVGAALDLAADYVKTREAFGQPIARFQAVGQRLADAFTQAWAVQLTARQAAWLLAQGRPAGRQVAVAKHQAAVGASTVIRAAHHVHGGIGLDRDYPLHRYTLWAKRLELSLGGSATALCRLGADLADRGEDDWIL